MKQDRPDPLTPPHAQTTANTIDATNGLGVARLLRRGRDKKKRSEDDSVVKVDQTDEATQLTSTHAAEGDVGSSETASVGPQTADVQFAAESVSAEGIQPREFFAPAAANQVFASITKLDNLPLTLGAAWITHRILRVDGPLVPPPSSVVGTVPESAMVSGSIVLGPAVAGNTLVIRAYDATGQLLAQSPLNADGNYSLSISSGYTGPVLLRISDTDEGDDYIDEFTGKPRDLDGELRSVAVIDSSGIATAHVTPLTELVLRMLGLPAGQSGAEGITLGNISAEQITEVKTKLAQALGLDGIDLTTARPDPIIDVNGRIDLSRANAYGRLLAALSGMEAGEGHSTDQMLQTLLASIDLQTGTLSQDGLMDLVSGARLVAKNNPAADALFSDVGKAMGLSPAQIDGIDSAWSTLITLADGVDNNGAGLSTVQLQALGVRRVEGGAKLDALNNVLDVKTSTVVQSRTKLQGWADTITVVFSKAAGGEATPTQDELEDLGLTDLTPGRTIDLVNKIATSPDDGRDVDSLAKLQALVDVVAPTTSLSALTLGSDTGLSASDWITREAVQTLTARLSDPLLPDEQLLGSVDGGAAWQNISGFVNGTTLSWTGATLVGASTIKLKVIDAALNEGPVTERAYVLDTASPNLQIIQTNATIAGDGILNAAESATGLQLSGTTEPGLDVIIATASRTEATVTADGAGAWSATIPAASLPPRGNVSLTITSSDWAGNTATVTRTVTVDTTAPALTITQMEGQIAGDGMINAAERHAGVVLSGMTEASRSVTLATGTGSDVTVSADGTGAWSATVPAANLPESGTVTFTVTSSNAVGNTATVTRTATVDTNALDTRAPEAELRLAPHVTLEEPVDGYAMSQILSLPEGEFLVCWVGDAGRTIYAQRFDDTGPLAEPVPVATVDLALQGTIDSLGAVCLGEGMGWAMTWSLYLNDHSDTRSYVQVIANNGQAGDPLLLDAENTRYASDPKIAAVGSNGKFVVVWGALFEPGGQGGYGSYEAYLKRFSLDDSGQAIAEPPIVLPRHPQATGNQEKPQVAALGSEGDFVVVWRAGDAGSASSPMSDWSLIAQRFDQDGVAFEEGPLFIEPDPVTDHEEDIPRIAALGTDGAFVLVYESYPMVGEGPSQSFVTYVDSEGVISDALPLLAPGMEGVNAQSPVVSVLSENSFVVAWILGEFGEQAQQVCVQRFAVDLAGNITAETVHKLPALSAYSEVWDLQLLPWGEGFAMSWTTWDGEIDRVLVRLFDDAGLPVGGAQQLRDPSALEANSLQMAALTGGDLVLSWVSLFDQDVGPHVKKVSVQRLELEHPFGVGVSFSSSADEESVSASWLRLGDTMNITLSFNEELEVSGTPRISLQLGDGEAWANYVSGHGTADLVFSYTVQAGQSDPDGILLGELELNGGAITDAAGNAAVLPETGAVQLNTGYRVDTQAPIADAGLGMPLELVETIGFLEEMAASTTLLHLLASEDGKQFQALTAVYVQNFFEGSQGFLTQQDFLDMRRLGDEFSGLGLIDIFTSQMSLVFGLGSDAAGLPGGGTISAWQSPDQLNENNQLTSDLSIYFQFSNFGGFESAPLEGASNNTPIQDGDDIIPKVAALNSGAVITWIGETAPDVQSVFVQRILPDGDLGPLHGFPVAMRQTDFMIWDLPIISPAEVAAVGSDGGFVVAWSGADSVDPVSDDSIFVARFDASGNPVLLNGQPDVVRLEPHTVTDGHDLMPQVVAVGTAGAFAVVWCGQDDEENYKVFVQLFDDSGAPSGFPIELEEPVSPGLFGEGFVPQAISLGTSGFFAVAWSGSVGGQTKVFVHRLDQEGLVREAAVMLEDPLRDDAINSNPQLVALGNGGEFAVTWQSVWDPTPGYFGDEQSSALVQRFDTSGNPVGDPWALQLPQGEGQANAPKIAALGTNGDFVVGWTDYSLQNPRAFVQRFNADGSKGADQTIFSGDDVLVSSSEPGMAYLVNTNADIESVTDILELLANSSESCKAIPIYRADMLTALSTTGLAAGHYRLYTVDAAGYLSAPSDKVIVVRPAPLDLGEVGINVDGFVVSGEQEGDTSGSMVSAAGDVNGDGLSDLLIAALGANNSGGRTYVVFGKTGTEALALSGLGSMGFVIEGDAGGGWGDHSVAGVGDVNGDGLDDLIIGSSSSSSDVGDSYVVFGKSDNSTVNLSTLASSAGFVLSATSESAPSVSAAGDVNGDGLADLLVGIATSNDYAGRSYVVFGKSDSNPVDLTNLGIAGFAINGETMGDRSGDRVSAAGDFNGDGLSDLLIAASGASNWAGKAYVVFGKTDHQAVDLIGGVGGHLVIHGQSGVATEDLTVAAAGDVNGDGLADVIIGAPSDRTSSPGRSYVVFGRTDTSTPINLSSLGSGGFAIESLVPSDMSGRSVATAGDLNGDGLSDLLVGAPGWGYTNEDRGHTYVIFGRTSTTPVHLSGIAAGSGGFVVAGQSNGDQSGSSVSAAGDVDGDGLADLIIGAPYAGLEAGKSYVIFGSAVRQLYDTAVDHLDDSDDDALSDGGTAKTLVGGAGNDSLTAIAASVLYGGASDDLFMIGPAMIEALQSPMGSDMDRLARVDGGSGIDTLKLDGGTDLTLDMTLIANPAAGAPHGGSRLSSIEIIDLTGTGDNTLRLSAADVLDLVGFNAFEDTGRRQLMIKGDEGDQVELVDSGWQEIERAIWEHDVSLATLYLAPNVAFSQNTIVFPPLELA